MRFNLNNNMSCGDVTKVAHTVSYSLPSEKCDRGNSINSDGGTKMMLTGIQIRIHAADTSK